MTKRNWRVAASAAMLGALAAAPAWGLEISVLSSAPQLATGGDALIQITGLTHFPTVSLRGRDVKVDLRTDPKDPGKWIGLLYGLIDGNNLVTVQSGRDMASINIVNSPINGTLFAGPQDAPFLCELDAFGFTPTNTTKLDPRNADCAVSPKVAYYY